MRVAAAIVAMALLAGCTHRPPATTRPSVATTQPSYWLDQPAVAHASSTDFDKLWQACEVAARGYGFSLDRQDYRGGLLTTVPLVSAQWFEPWRPDVKTLEDSADSSLATYRRTLRFQIAREADGTYVATPMVLVERYAQAGRQVVASVYLRDAFRTKRGTRQMSGSAEADRGIYLPKRYWYATGRDSVLEHDIARSVEKRVRKS